MTPDPTPGLTPGSTPYLTPGPTPHPAPGSRAPHLTHRALPGPPPWLWLVLGLYVSQLPAGITWWTDQFRDLLGHGSYSPEVAASGGFLALTALSVVQLMPVTFLLAGVFGVLLPHLRRAIVERRYDLRGPDDPQLARSLPPEAEVLLGRIRRFLDEQAPGVELRFGSVVGIRSPASTRAAGVRPVSRPSARWSCCGAGTRTPPRQSCCTSSGTTGMGNSTSPGSAARSWH